jgi:prophage regulatory protein
VERLQKIIRERDLPQFVGLHRTQIAQLIADGEFPAPIKLSDSGRSKGWLEADLIVWQRNRITKRDGKPAD